MGQPAARVGDMHVCPMFDGPKPHVGGPVLPPGKPTVLIGGMPAATITDRCVCASVPDIIMQGAQTVLINNMMAARMGDATVHGGRIVAGCPTVLIGGPTYTTPSFFARFLNIFLDNVKFTAGVVVGFGEGLFNTVESLISALTHPIDTIKGLFRLADSIISTLAKKETWAALTKKETWQKIRAGVEQVYDDFEKASPYEKGKVVGHATEFMAELLVPVAKAKLATEAIEASKVAEVTRVAANISEATKSASKGLTESEVVRLERRKEALEFYKKHNPNVPPRELHSQVIGIDLDYPVEVVTIPPHGQGNTGNVLYQWVKEGEDGIIYPGQYYAVDKNSTPAELGISPDYNVRKADKSHTDQVKSLIQQEVSVNEPVIGLKTKAKDIDDTWSRKPISPKQPTRVPTRGGAEQIYIPSRSVNTTRILTNTRPN